MSNSKSQKTMCIHSGQFHDSLTHGVLTPIFPSTSHAYLDLEKKAYPRYFNTPNQEVLAAKLAELEHGEAGILFASGMAAISNEKYINQIVNRGKNLGGSLNAQTCALLERSVKTLALRMEQHNRNAQAVAEFLHGHESVVKVFYPGLPSHEGHELAKKQMHGFSGMLTFTLADHVNPVLFQKRLKMIKPSMSLGGVESTICSPALTSHSTLTAEARTAEGVSDNMLRLSVGIEEADDLIDDLNIAFESF